MNEEPFIHRKLSITGRVQGVFYRATAVDKARELGVHGFVRNEEGGIVYIEVEGSRDAVDKLIQWCKSGPTFAKVEEVSVTDGEVIGFNEFQITS